jgi:hypothetical protein
MAVDARGWQVAIVADSLLPDALDVLESEGWGAIQLPPAELETETAQLWLEQVAEHAAEFHRNGYAVVVMSDGLYDRELRDALGAVGIASLPQVEPTRNSLAEHAVPAPPSR